jgi:hypothetical protein
MMSRINICMEFALNNPELNLINPFFLELINDVGRDYLAKIPSENVGAYYAGAKHSIYGDVFKNRSLP